MTTPKLTKLELQIMEAIWSQALLRFEKFKRRFARTIGMAASFVNASSWYSCTIVEI